MRSQRDDFRFTVMMGVRKGFRLIRGARKAFSEDQEKAIAEAVVEHVERSNWKVEQEPSAPGHAGLYRGPPASS